MSTQPAQPPTSGYAADLAAIRRAADRIRPEAHVTPVLTCTALDDLSGRRLFLKCEHLQKVGAFKFRGALNAVRKLSEEDARRGVVTHSSGNFAQALALAARVRGIDAHIVMPSNASTAKRRAVEGYGARVIECEPTLAARDQVADVVVAETGGVFLPSYDHPDVIAGQGTAGLELHEQVPALDAVVVPLGGGGLISGIALAYRELAPTVAVIGAEPTGADDAARSKAAGDLLGHLPGAPDSLADGLLTTLGRHTWPVVRDIVSEVVTVDDTATVAAMRLAWQRTKQLVEPSAAVAVAVAMSSTLSPSYGRVGVILSGGNVDLDRLPWGQEPG